MGQEQAEETVEHVRDGVRLRTAPLIFTRTGVRNVDRAAIEEFGVPGVVLMENAAAALELAALELLADRSGGAVLCCGPGANGGDGFALARRLANADVAVACLVAAELERVTGDALINLEIVRKMGLPLQTLSPTASVDEAAAAIGRLGEEVGGAALLVDALLGTGAVGPLRDPLPSLVAAINRFGDEGARILAVDIPTGLDCDTGEPFEARAVVEADATVTFCGLKMGFRRPGAAVWLGRVIVGDIGAPREALLAHAEQPHKP